MRLVEKIYIENNLEYNNENTIIVAGTNGKGSTCKYLEKVLVDAGYKVGKFTSPHIYTHLERITINGENIPNEVFEKYNLKYKEYNLNFFENFFIIACDYFKEEKVDIIIMETGIGGLLDTTNILNAKYAIITSISFDHTEILGNTLEEIAYQKAGICKNNKICIYNEEIKILDNFTHLFTENIKRTKITKEIKEILEKSNINKSEQISNFLNCYEIFKRYNIKDEDILQSLKDFSIKFRQEKIIQKYNGKELELIVDVAHNEDSFNKLFDFLDNNYKEKNIVFLISMLKNKDFKSIYNILLEKKYNVFVYELPNELKGMNKKEISTLLNIEEENILSIENNLNREIEKISDIIKTNNNLFVIAGSFYFVSKYINL